MSHDTTHGPHVMPLWLYLAVGGALLVLTVITVLAAQVDFSGMLGIPSLNLVVAMAIATLKATLVALFFMHLLYDNKIYTIALLGGILTLGIFIAITLTDTLRRGDVHEIEKSLIKKQAIIYDNLKSTPATDNDNH